MDFLILGPLEVRSGGRPLDPGAAKQRAVLAVLLLHAGEVVSSDRIVDELWGDRPPPSAAKLVQGYVSGLRRVLGDAIRTRPPGYVLEVDPDAVDAHRFQQLAGAGRPHDALGLWRGRALADVVLKGPAARDADRLDELRLVVTEARIDVDLRAGRHAELAGELERLVAEHPLRERFHAQLMLALYRAQRQAEALEVYRRARHAFVEELGIEPGRELQELEQAILRHDPALEPRAVEATLRRRRWVLAAAVALLAVAAVATAATMRGGKSSPPVVLAGNSVAVLDPATGRILGEIPIGGRPSSVAVGESAVWAANEDDDTLIRIDPSTRRVVRSIGLGVRPTDVAVGGGAVWVASEFAGEVLRVDPISNEPTARISFAPTTGADRLDVAAGGGAVWVADSGARVALIHPATSAIVRRLDLQARTNFGRTVVAIGEGVVWVGVEERLIALNPASASVAEIDVGAIGSGAGVAGLGTGGGALWLTAYPNKALLRVDLRERRVVAVLPLPHIPWKLAFGAGYVWISTGVPVLLRVDPRTHAVDEIALGVYTSQTSGEPIAVGHGAVWVAVRR